jgi:hypothetical protein
MTFTRNDNNFFWRNAINQRCSCVIRRDHSPDKLCFKASGFPSPEKGNLEAFYEVMKVFYAEAIREWVEAGNLAEELEGKSTKVVIILDNASFHKKAEIRQFKKAIASIFR